MALLLTGEQNSTLIFLLPLLKINILDLKAWISENLRY